MLIQMEKDTTVTATNIGDDVMVIKGSVHGESCKDDGGN